MMERDKVVIMVGALALLAVGGAVVWRAREMLAEPRTAPVHPSRPGGSIPPPPKMLKKGSPPSDVNAHFYDDLRKAPAPKAVPLPYVYRAKMGNQAVLEDLETGRQTKVAVGDRVRDAEVAVIDDAFVRLTRGTESFTLSRGEETFAHAQLPPRGAVPPCPYAFSDEDRAFVQRLRGIPMTANIQQASMAEVATAIGQMLGVKIDVSAPIKDVRPVFHPAGEDAVTALDRFAEENKLLWVPGRGEVLFFDRNEIFTDPGWEVERALDRLRQSPVPSDPAPGKNPVLDRPITVQFDSTPLYAVTKELDRLTDVKVMLDPAIWGDVPRVTLGGKMTGREALDAIAQLLGIRWAVDGSEVYLFR